MLTRSKFLLVLNLSRKKNVEISTFNCTRCLFLNLDHFFLFIEFSFSKKQAFYATRCTRHCTIFLPLSLSLFLYFRPSRIFSFSSRSLSLLSDEIPRLRLKTKHGAREEEKQDREITFDWFARVQSCPACIQTAVSNPDASAIRSTAAVATATACSLPSNSPSLSASVAHVRR